MLRCMDAIPENPNTVLTVRHVAEILGVDDYAVRRWLRDGKLKGRNLGGQSGWRVLAGDLLAFVRDEPQETADALD